MTTYEDDVAAWAIEQVALLRAGHFDQIDVEHIAEEIEDMNLSNRHQLAHRMSVLLAHLLKWQRQPERRGSSWERTIRTQRDRIARLLRRMPSLRHLLADDEWSEDVWDDAVSIAEIETNLHDLPQTRPWTYEQFLAPDFFPDS